MENFPQGQQGKTRDIVAKESGFGSGKQYNKAKYIYENGSEELIKQLDENTGTPREDMILEDLICTNIMQRGIGNINPMKMAKCIKELERIYGIRQGSAGKVTVLDGNNFPPNKTQEDLAKQIGIDQRQLQNYKKLNELIPELQSLVENGQRCPI